MKFKYYLLNILFPLFNFLNIKKKCNFRILMLHCIKKENFKLLENNLKALKYSYNFIDPNKLSKHYYPASKNNLLLTFDDGFKSNFFFANKVLKKLEIKGIFFVISDLVNSRNKKKKIIIQNIFPNKKIFNFSTYHSMSWSDLRKLEKMGHVIGSHTKSHLNLNNINSQSILEEQITSPIKTFKKNKIKKPLFFAYSFGNFYSFNQKCFKIATKNYRFIFSGIRGDNSKFNKMLYRDNIEDNYSFQMINFFISGYSDFLYKKFRKIFSSF